MPVDAQALHRKWQPKLLRDSLDAIEANSFDPIAFGQKSNRVKLVQEWLTLQGHGTDVDRDFGPATRAAVRGYQTASNLAVTGEADSDTFLALTRPMVNALRPIANPGTDLGETAVAYARQHLAANAFELGGANLGPWVRLYMGGNEGRDWLWCAGFACFVMRQAAQTLGLSMPIKSSYSCDVLAERAKNANRFVAHNRRANAEPRPGWLFLIRKSATDWTHVGLVTGVDDDIISTLEGNTNFGGSRNGGEVCARHRKMSSKVDFIRMD